MFILTILACASFITVIRSQPTHAESVLLNTVRCTVRFLIAEECNRPVVTPQVQAPAQVQPPAPTAPAPQASSPAPTPPPPTQGTAPAQSTSAAQGRTVQPGSVVGDNVAPIEIDQSLLTKPQAPQQVRPYRYALPDHAVLSMTSYKIGGSATFASVGPAQPVAASQEGWKILGIAWYWWLLLVGIFLGVATVVRHRYLRNPSVLSKA